MEDDESFEDLGETMAFSVVCMTKGRVILVVDAWDKGRRCCQDSVPFREGIALEGEVVSICNFFDVRSVLLDTFSLIGLGIFSLGVEGVPVDVVTLSLCADSDLMLLEEDTKEGDGLSDSGDNIVESMNLAVVDRTGGGVFIGEPFEGDMDLARSIGRIR